MYLSTQNSDTCIDQAFNFCVFVLSTLQRLGKKRLSAYSRWSGNLQYNADHTLLDFVIAKCFNQQITISLQERKKIHVLRQMEVRVGGRED